MQYSFSGMLWQNIKVQFVILTFRMCWIRWWGMTNCVWIPKKTGTLSEQSAEVRGYCQDALKGMRFISLLKRWVIHLLTRVLLSLPIAAFQRCEMSKKGNSAVLEMENWDTVKHPAWINKLHTVISFVFWDFSTKPTNKILHSFHSSLPYWLCFSCRCGRHPRVCRIRDRILKLSHSVTSVLLTYALSQSRPKTVMSGGSRRAPEPGVRPRHGAQNSYTGTQRDNNLIIANTHSELLRTDKSKRTKKDQKKRAANRVEK